MELKNDRRFSRLHKTSLIELHHERDAHSPSTKSIYVSGLCEHARLRIAASALHRNTRSTTQGARACAVNTVMLWGRWMIQNTFCNLKSERFCTAKKIESGFS